MKRLRLLFGIILLALALPIWRFLDLIAVLSPLELPLTLSLIFTFAAFVLIPLKLIIQRLKTYLLLIVLTVFAFAAWRSPSVSTEPNADPVKNHCGSMTWAGAFYPFRNLLTEAHLDDLEARNQMCWLRKLINKVPNGFQTVDGLESYSKSIRDLLLKPQIKYRIALPLISFLQMSMIAEVESARLGTGQSHGKMFFESIHFWQEQYTVLISERSYGLGSFPHSSWIKVEYGFLEDNWQKIVNGLTFESR